jgi:hypothetical protein
LQGFFESLFGSDEKKPEPKKDSEPGFFEKLFGGDKKDDEVERKRSVKDAATLSDTKRTRSAEIEEKKIPGMHSNVKGFK